MAGVEMAAVADRGGDRRVPLHRRSLFRVQPHEILRRRLVPAPGGRGRVRPPDDLGQGPATGEPAARRRIGPARDFHQVGRAERAARAQHGRFHDQHDRRRSAGPAAQSQAQHGASRAQHPPDPR